MSVVLCIGGLDPSGRAGVLADARACEAQGARACVVATATTIQSSKRAGGFEAVSPEIVRRQMAMLLGDEPVRVAKLGQLVDEEMAKTVLEALGDLPFVLDTPLATSSGMALFQAESVREAYRPLVERALLVTPNAVEVDVLGGEQELCRASKALLLKGGHHPGDDVVDVLVTDGVRRAFSSKRIPGKFRGTGCRLASAIAARIALGDELESSVRRARAWLRNELEREWRISNGVA